MVAQQQQQPPLLTTAEDNELAVLDVVGAVMSAGTLVVASEACARNATVERDQLEPAA